MPQVRAPAELPLQGVRNVRRQAGPPQRLAELLRWPLQPSVLPGRIVLLAARPPALCEPVPHIRVPSDADLHRVWRHGDAAGRLQRHLLPVRHCTLLHRRHLCPSYVLLHLDLTIETVLSDLPWLHRHRVAAGRAYQPAELSRQLEDVLPGTIRARKRKRATVTMIIESYYYHYY